MYTPRYRPRARRFWVSIGIAAILLSPLAFLELEQVGQVSWETPPPLSVTIGLALLSVMVGVAFAVFRVGHSASERAALITLTVPWLLIPPTILAVAAQITPMWENRYLLFCAPAVAILAVAAIASMPSMRSEAAAMALLVAIALAGQPLIRMIQAPDDLRAVATLLAAESQRGDAVVFPPQASELGRRLILAAYPSDFKNLRDIGFDNSLRYRYTLYGRNVSPAVLDRRLVGVKRLWLIEFPTRYPPQRYGATAAPYPFCATQTWQIPGSTLTLYRRCAR